MIGSALPHYETAFRIFDELTKAVPDFAEWVRDKEVVEAELAICRNLVQTAGPPDAAVQETHPRG